MKRLLLFCTLALGLFVSFAHAGFTEFLTVQVFDQDVRPVQNAQAYVEYQLNAVNGNTKTKPVLTDENGHVNVTFTNYEEIPDSTDTSYKLYVKYGDQLSTVSLIASNTTSSKRRVVTATTTAYIAYIRVRDQKNRVLIANITANGQTKKTDEIGTVWFQLPPGDYLFRADTGGSILTKQTNITRDQSLDIVFEYYNLRVRVSDDFGEPLNAVVEVEGRSGNTDSEGEVYFENLTSKNPQMLVKYRESFKRPTVSLDRQQEVDVVFDLTKPVVKELHATMSASGAGTISAYMEDTGLSASGVDTVLVTYEVDGVENSVPAYAVGYNTFEAKIPSQAPGTLVKYLVRVTDKEGNVGLGGGTYYIEEEQVGITAPPPQTDGNSISMESIVIGGITFLAIAYGVFYYFKRKKSEELPKPPQTLQPPTVPQQ